MTEDEKKLIKSIRKEIVDDPKNAGKTPDEINLMVIEEFLFYRQCDACFNDDHDLTEDDVIEYYDEDEYPMIQSLEDKEEVVVESRSLSQTPHNNDTASEQKSGPDLYELGMQYAYDGEFQKSIEILKRLESTNNSSVFNNIGVDYEMLAQYENAAKYYRLAKMPLSYENLLKLYIHKHIPFNEVEYTNACYELIGSDDYRGYVYISKLYDETFSGKRRHPEKALNYAKKGYEEYPEKPIMVFQYAWCLVTCGQGKKDKELAHQLYETILEKKDDSDIHLVARHNYACQCEKGQGCKKDIEKAIYWFTINAEDDYLSSATALVDIYTSTPGKVNRKLASYWKKRVEEIKKK